MDNMASYFGKLGLSSVLRQDALPNSTSSVLNDTRSASPFPPDMMDTFLASAGRVSPLMQVVLFVYRLLGSQLGLDPSVLLTTMGFFWGLSKVMSQVYNYVLYLLDSYFMCAMFVSEDDHIYMHLMKWLSQQPSIRNNQYLMAQTVWKSAWDEEDDVEDALDWTDGGEGDGNKYLNFSSQAARSVSKLR